MLTYTFENRGKKSYYQYLYEQMKEDILEGNWRRERSCPPSGVSRST